MGFYWADLVNYGPMDRGYSVTTGAVAALTISTLCPPYSVQSAPFSFDLMPSGRFEHVPAIFLSSSFFDYFKWGSNLNELLADVMLNLPQILLDCLLDYTE